MNEYKEILNVLYIMINKLLPKIKDFQEISNTGSISELDIPYYKDLLQLVNEALKTRDYLIGNKNKIIEVLRK